MVSILFIQTIIAGFSILIPFAQTAPLKSRATSNDFSCRSAAHPNPVVLLHGLIANQYDGLYALELYLNGIGFCTFSLTYGEYPEFPLIGGLQPVATSAQEIASFIKTVQAGTGASKIDLIGHSEGGFQVLYVPKFEAGISSIVDKAISVAPPTHGTDLDDLYNLTFLGGDVTNELVQEALNTVGCAACDDLVPNSDIVMALNNGPIVQPGNQVTVIYSSKDEIVTPPSTASPVNEIGVRNIVVQSECPDDVVGHVGLTVDTYVWGLIQNTLDPTLAKKGCTFGLPL